MLRAAVLQYCLGLPGLGSGVSAARKIIAVKKKPVKEDVEVSLVSNWPSSDAFWHAPIEEDSELVPLLFFRKIGSP